jgi:hypothetical protein
MRTQVLLVSMLWLVVGSSLVVVGARWAWAAWPVTAPWIAGATFAIGMLKSRWILDAVATRVVERILARGDGRCIGGFLSLYTWGVVALMMLAGNVLRGVFARGLVGPLYIAVGVALCVASRISWRAWWCLRSIV